VSAASCSCLDACILFEYSERDAACLVSHLWKGSVIVMDAVTFYGIPVPVGAVAVYDTLYVHGRGGQTRMTVLPVRPDDWLADGPLFTFTAVYDDAVYRLAVMDVDDALKVLRSPGLIKVRALGNRKMWAGRLVAADQKDGSLLMPEACSWVLTMQGKETMGTEVFSDLDSIATNLVSDIELMLEAGDNTQPTNEGEDSL